jgi:hypothetical protein
MNPTASSAHNRRPEARPSEVIRYFDKLYEGGPRTSGSIPYRLTSRGAWARSRPAHLFFFFKKVGLSSFRLVVDLGSGDGTASCMAGLFTRALGIEADPELASQAMETARRLGMDERVGFICADFFTQSIRNADCLYIYPDKPVYDLEEALEGWEGTLLIYGPHFPPKRLRLTEKLTCGKETLSIYRGWDFTTERAETTEERQGE